MIIRRANITDIFELSRLWSYMVKESDSTLKPNLDMWRGNVFGLMNQKNYVCFAAEEQDKLVGFIDYAMTPDPGFGYWVAVINHFYVLPDNRTEASGKLWVEAIESARKAEAKEFVSTCFVEKLEFWKKHGFKENGFTIRREI